MSKTKRISPEDDKLIDWVLTNEKMLTDLYEAKMNRKAKRNKTLTFNNGYGMIVSTRKK